MTAETSTPFPLTEAPAPLPTATAGAMQLFFPTVIPVQGAEYRPPLYPIPWALSPYDHFYFAAPIAAAFPANRNGIIRMAVFSSDRILFTPGLTCPLRVGPMSWPPVLEQSSGPELAFTPVHPTALTILMDWQSPSAMTLAIKISNSTPSTPTWRRSMWLLVNG